MGYRRTYLRRLRAAKRLEKRLAVVAVAGVLACAAGLLVLRDPAPDAQDQTAPPAQSDAAPARQALQLVAAAAPAHAQARRVYPFSIVPGGVAGRAELVHVVQTDRVAAVHYAGFQVARTTAVTVRRPRAVYVSYRKGDKVYWTSKKVMLAQGETLLSDGSSEIRTRCGNRISDVPRMPVADGEPTVQVLDTAMDVNTDDGGDAQRQAGSASGDAGADAANGAPAVGQTYRLATFMPGGGLAPASTRNAMALALLGMSGMATGAPSVKPERLVALAPLVVKAQIGTAGDADAAPGSPGPAAGGTAGTGSATGSGSTTGSGGSVGGSDGGDTSGAPSTITPVLGDEGDSPTAGIPAETPPPPDPLSPSGAPPVVAGKAPATPSEVPEPGSLWLSGAALAAMFLLRRKNLFPNGILCMAWFYNSIINRIA